MILRLLILSLLAAAVAIAIPGRSLAITLGEFDNFSATLEGWGSGASVGVGYVNYETTGGPAGVGDKFLKYNANPAVTRDKLVGFNQSQWAGNYIAAGITSISMSLKNLGTTPLAMRLSLGTANAPLSGGEWFTSTVPINLPPLSGWMDVSFPIGVADLTDFTGMGVYPTAMSSVVTLRLLHQSDDPSPIGSSTPELPLVLGVDNVFAIRPDFNGSGKVTAADLNKWRTDMGAGAGSDADGDLDSDGRDFLIWQQHLGEGAGSMAVGAASAVPEPSTAGLALFAALAVGAQRFRNRGGKTH